MLGLVLAIVVLIVAFALLLGLSRHQDRSRRATFIAGYRFPEALVRKYAEDHAALDAAQVRMVFEGLRQFFLACLAAQETSIARSVGMPSRAVDDAWHDFILMTRDYQGFCREAFGKYLHHTPETAMATPMPDALANTLHQTKHPLPGGVAWATAGAIPLLFAMDRELGVAEGYHHDADSLGSLEAVRVDLANNRALQQDRDKSGSGGAACGGGGGGGCCGSSCCGGGCGGGGCGS